MKVTKRSWLSAELVTVLLLRVSVGFACSPLPPPSVEVALREAKFVVSVKPISIHQQRILEKDYSYVIEKVAFKVLESFKGPYEPGSVLHFITSLAPGTCGVSVRNHPVWVLGVDKQGKPYAPVLSGRWLIYGNGHPPYQLEALGRTQPMEASGEADVEKLRSMLRVKRHRAVGRTQPN